jgi:signal-transduction protein with cAMP-binding, CBS, and nucleotidyltransferase domain
MAERQCRHLLVLGHGCLEGIISDRDLSVRRGQTARDLMTRDPATVDPSTTVFDAVSQMLARHISCLPVVEGGRVAGVITTTDLLMALQCTARLLEQLGVSDWTGQPLAHGAANTASRACEPQPAMAECEPAAV